MSYSARGKVSQYYSWVLIRADLSGFEKWSFKNVGGNEWQRIGMTEAGIPREEATDNTDAAKLVTEYLESLPIRDISIIWNRIVLGTTTGACRIITAFLIGSRGASSLHSGTHMKSQIRPARCPTLSRKTKTSARAKHVQKRTRYVLDS
jgi:hypothetical protein